MPGLDKEPGSEEAEHRKRFLYRCAPADTGGAGRFRCPVALACADSPIRNID